MSAFMTVVETSPNQAIGHGNGCIVSEVDQVDCHGPWVLFPHTERASGFFPHTTICQHHLDEAQRLMLGEVLAGGEDGDVIESEAVEEPDEDVLAI